MLRENATDLLAFLAVADEGSFTKAAARLGVSQSALSQNIRHLEERLGLRLLARTTRRVAPTEAGERLRRSIAPRFREIEADLRALTELEAAAQLAAGNSALHSLRGCEVLEVRWCQASLERH